MAAGFHLQSHKDNNPTKRVAMHHMRPTRTEKVPLPAAHQPECSLFLTCRRPTLQRMRAVTTQVHDTAGSEAGQCQGRAVKSRPTVQSAAAGVPVHLLRENSGVHDLRHRVPVAAVSGSEASRAWMIKRLARLRMNRQLHCMHGLTGRHQGQASSADVRYLSSACSSAECAASQHELPSALPMAPPAW